MRYVDVQVITFVIIVVGTFYYYAAAALLPVVDAANEYE